MGKTLLYKLILVRFMWKSDKRIYMDKENGVFVFIIFLGLHNIINPSHIIPNYNINRVTHPNGSSRIKITTSNLRKDSRFRYVSP